VVTPKPPVTSSDDGQSVSALVGLVLLLTLSGLGGLFLVAGRRRR
jgi:hypothetical protein